MTALVTAVQAGMLLFRLHEDLLRNNPQRLVGQAHAIYWQYDPPFNIYTVEWDVMDAVTFWAAAWGTGLAAEYVEDPDDEEAEL